MGNYTVRKIVISTGEVTTLAGTAGTQGSVDGTGSEAQFKSPTAITTNGTSLFLTDSDNHTIRKIVISTAAVTTFAGTAGVMGTADGIGTAASFYCPQGITTDGTNLYVVDSYNNSIRKIVISTGDVTTLAGTSCFYCYGSADGFGSAAGFSWPYGVTTDGSNLYVTDSTYAIRKIVLSTREVTTLASLAGTVGQIDGVGSNARFQRPYGITTDGVSVYVADTYNNTIRRIQ